MVNTDIVKARIRNIRRELSKKKLQALILIKSANVTYATGFLGDESWALVTKSSVYLITDSRFTEQAKGECPTCKIIERKDTLPKSTAKLLKRKRSIETVAVEDIITVAQMKPLRKESLQRIKTTSALVDKVRRTKTSDEVKCIRKAAQIAAQALKRARKKLRVGMTESEFTGILNCQMRTLGGQIGFETIACLGANGSRPHHQPGNTRLKKNDVILIDFGAKVNGYTCDITRTFPFGKPSRLFLKAYEAVNAANEKAIKALKSGVELKAIDKIAREEIGKRGFTPYKHGTGHGLGLEVHELPGLSYKSKGKLQAGDVITIEPGIYIPGKLGIRIEDDILIKDNGYQVLSDCCGKDF